MKWFSKIISAFVRKETDEEREYRGRLRRQHR